MRTPYEILGISSGASAREIRKAYCTLALRYHPDKNPNGAAAFREATDAYKTLTDPSYDPAGVSAPPRAPRPPPSPTEPTRPFQREPPSPPSPPDPDRPWPASGSWTPPSPWSRAEPSYDSTFRYARYPSEYNWGNFSPDILGQMIEILFEEEFGIRWADLPQEAQEVLIRSQKSWH